MDTACVELKFTDGNMISIDTITVENEVADYAPTYNACVCWDYKHGKNEGIRLAAFCG